MEKLKCLNCGFKGEEFSFRVSRFTYCIGQDIESTEFINPALTWVKAKYAERNEKPISCPKCHVWGEFYFVPVRCRGAKKPPSSSRLVRSVKQARADIKAGRTKSLEEVFGRRRRAS